MLPALLLATLVAPASPVSTLEPSNLVEASYLGLPAETALDDDRVREDGTIDWEQPRNWRPEAGQNYVELALDDETFWVSYGRRYANGSGLFSVGVLGSDDDELVATARVLTIADYAEPLRYRLGIGLAVYALTADKPNVDAQALALTGLFEAEFNLPTTLRAGIDVAYAPDVSTFDDGDGLLDVWLRAELELSPRAQAFIGYRVLEIELEGGPDRDLGESVQIGVRLGW